MSIVVKDHLFTLHTKNTSYQLTADDHGILRHLYYDAKAGDTVAKLNFQSLSVFIWERSRQTVQLGLPG